MMPTETRVIKSMTQEERIESGYAFAKEAAGLPVYDPGAKAKPFSWLSSPVEAARFFPPLMTARQDAFLRAITEQFDTMLVRTFYFTIDRVIFNDPATVVYWKDGTKTVVKCQPGDEFSKETGLAVAFMKKALGNKGNFNDIFRKLVYEDE